ncbi:hypothetical protein, partial [Pseudomonas syringae]|uniref:hypothetical protein n=1 Tax=Pseudomonas syringae TaxID=317 RepID=UPI0019D340EE
GLILSCPAPKCSSEDVGIFSSRPKIDRYTPREKAFCTVAAHHSPTPALFSDENQAPGRDCPTIRRPVTPPRDVEKSGKKAQRQPGCHLQPATTRGVEACARHSQIKKSKLLQNRRVS